MEPLSEGRLSQGGLEGDDHFSPESARQLLLVDVETLDALNLSPGDIRENLTVRGVDVMGLRPGTTIQLGDAHVEITKECTPCRNMEAIRPGLMTELSGRRGMLARVVAGGAVRPGDRVEVIETEPLLR
ncbi:MAG TPA: MOSC domain-containing protein [Actinomycetota bacterium]